MRNYICLYCNKEFQSNKLDKTRIPKYCSKSCYSSMPKTDENLLKLSNAKKGKEPHNKLPKITTNCLHCNKEITNRIGATYQKKFCSKECTFENYKNRKYPERSKENSHFWRGGLTTENEKMRHSAEYRNWQKDVFKRDNFSCQKCNKTIKETILHAHHIEKFSQNIEKRYDVNNGLTLCIDCHGELHGLNFSDLNLNKCLDCGKKIKKGAKRCKECRMINTQKVKDSFYCQTCGTNKVKCINRDCKSCSAKKRLNNFGRNKIRA